MASALAEQMDSILISENVLQAVHAALDTNIRVTKIWISAVGDGVIAHQLSMPTDTQPALANSSEGQILIAEDHADLREIFATVLRRAGYTVNIAANGHEAMQFLNRGLPDLLLLDINMPGPSGLEILRYIRQSQKPVKVIVITANSQAGRTAEADMADLFLLKPVRMTEVVQLANRFVRAGA
jgi:CheY-like chemotaxis protein